jgi:hypothetical protein
VKSVTAANSWFHRERSSPDEFILHPKVEKDKPFHKDHIGQIRSLLNCLRKQDRVKKIRHIKKTCFAGCKAGKGGRY